jgi:hypothetical protein
LLGNKRKRNVISRNQKTIGKIYCALQRRISAEIPFRGQKGGEGFNGNGY